MKENVVMVKLTGEERKRVIAEFERYEEEESRFVDELKRLIDGNSYDHIKEHIEAFYDTWEEHKGITLLLEDIQAALSKQDEAVKPALLPIWRDFVNEKIGGFPIVEECTVMEGLKQRLMLYKIGGVSYFGARKHIQAYFQCERESERMNDSIAYMLGKENKEGFVKRFKNTTDEALLYPLLYQEALLELEEMRVSDKHKKRAKGHLERFVKEWENARKDEASEPQQVPQKRKGAPKNVLTERAKKYFQRAIEAGYMEETATGYKWGHDMRGDKIKLGYFLKTVYNPKESSQIPYGALGTLFRESRLDSTISKIADWKNTPKWVEEINNTLFYD